MSGSAGRPVDRGRGTPFPTGGDSTDVPKGPKADDPRDTPMMRQYLAAKRQAPGSILFFRVGDFYETFEEDAVTTARALGITLTARQGIPLAGVPYHAVDGYLARMVRQGYRVAVSEQMEDPKTAKGLVRREIVRIVTPGTLADEPLLDARTNNYLVALAPSPASGDRDGRWGLAAVEASTGEFTATEVDPEELRCELARIRPAELLLPESLTSDLEAQVLRGCGDAPPPVARYAPAEHAGGQGERRIREFFGVATLDGYGLGGLALATMAASAALGYARENRRGAISFSGIGTYRADSNLVLDRTSQKNLELVANIRDGGTAGTLLSVLDRTRTPMGSRLLRRWILQPLRDPVRIGQRLDAVGAFAADGLRRRELEGGLRGCQDLERIGARVSAGTAGPRDLMALRTALTAVPRLQAVLHGVAGITEALAGALDPLPAVVERIGLAIADDPPSTAREGGIIRPGFDAALDVVRDGSRAARDWIAGLETRERERTGIRSLKVGYTRVFGYYIEVSKANLAAIPADYQRKQTVAGAERFVTRELQQREDEVLGADDRMRVLEEELFRSVRAEIARSADRILTTARSVAELDVLRALGELAAEHAYVRPEIVEGTGLRISAGRHPVVEAALPPGTFVPNDADLDPASAQLVILTGPNMAGKSTYLRQIGLIVLLAQMGSFVPARSATVGPVDRIFTRVGSADDLSRGQSTFLVEMAETAAILRSATPASLILLDEVGRGTSTFDGLALAWAIAEHLHEDPKARAKTVFATHFHELTELTEAFPRVRNFHIPVKETGEDLVFLRTVVPGSVDRSYGIQVAQLAGLPRSVVERAKEVLASIESQQLQVMDLVRKGGAATATSPTAPGRRSGKGRERPAPRPKFTQVVLWSPDLDGARPEHPVVAQLRKIEVDSMTPLEALHLLSRLREEANAAPKDGELGEPGPLRPKAEAATGKADRREGAP